MGAASQELTERAKLLISERRYQEAVRACRRALLSQPDEVEIRLLLGEALLALERYDEVRVEMMALARKAPMRAEVHRLLGEAYLRDGRQGPAVEALRKALELDPTDEMVRELLLEAADQAAPVSTTIERWFADEAVPTVETDVPAWEEEQTGPAPKHLLLGLSSEPPSSIHVDPSLKPIPPPRAAPPPKPAAAQTRPIGPRVRSKKPTMAGHPEELAPIAPPAPRPHTPPADPFPEESTQAQRPSARRAPPADPTTEEIDLVSLPDQTPAPRIDPRLEQSLRPEEFAEFAAFEDEPDVLTDKPTRARPISFAAAEEPATETKPQPPPRPPPPSPFFEPPPVAAAPAPSVAAAPPVAKPPEATTARVGQKKSWLLPGVVAAVLAFLVMFIAVVAIVTFINRSAFEQIHAQAQSAGDSGIASDIEASIRGIDAQEDDDPELMALKARLIATLVFEHGVDRAPEARALVTSVEDEELTDAQIARALLYLDAGNARQAVDALAGLPVEPTQLAEAYRTHALAKAALGDLAAAEESARNAAEARPSAPRHAALYALLHHRTGNSADALRFLDAVPDGARFPSIRVARARILMDAGGDDARAQEEAAAVIGELAARATAHEIAWAHLVRAHLAAEHGDHAGSLTEARAAAQAPPPADEPFGVALVDTFLKLGAPEDARRELARLSDPPEDQASRATRSLLSAEVALAVNDLDRAEAALAGAADTPRTFLLRAQILEARGRVDEARPLYLRASQAPGPEGRRAAVRLASLAMSAGNAQGAIDLLEPNRANAVDDSEYISILARAYLALNRLDPAEQAVNDALARRRDAPDLLAVRGSIELRRGRTTEALATLRQAVQARPTDADLQADLGDAARLAGESAPARQAYDAALAVRADHPRALLGLARLALAAGELDQVEQRLTALGEREPLEVARLRGELLVVRGEGALGVRVIAVTAARVDDAEVWTSLGHLLAQAENDREATRAYARALARDRNHPEALLGQSLVDVRRGDLGGARRAVATALQEGTRRHLGSAFLARLKVAQARLAFEGGRFDEVVELANEAVRLDPNIAAAHLLLANVAVERGDSPNEHLQRAVAAQAPPPEALGTLAIRLERGEDACRLGRRYLEIAPDGYDAPDVEDVVDDCR
jgi:tetratricopeptide (TPR) repeat protein